MKEVFTLLGLMILVFILFLSFDLITVCIREKKKKNRRTKMGRAAEIQQIKYLALRYPVRCSEIEQLYFDYVEETGRKDFIGFELTSQVFKRR